MRFALLILSRFVIRQSCIPMTCVSSFVCLRHCAYSLMAMSFFCSRKCYHGGLIVLYLRFHFLIFQGSNFVMLICTFLHVFVYKYLCGKNCSFHVCGHGIFEVEALCR